jgi:hypothetical protein
LQVLGGQHPLFYPLLIYLLLAVGVQVAHFHFQPQVREAAALVGIGHLPP